MIDWIKRNLTVVIILLAIFGSIGFYVGIKIADQPFFCSLLCHEMTPHVESLEANFHGKKGVICMDCHSKQGFWHHAEEHIVASVLVIPHITKIYLEDEHNFHADVPEFNPEEMNFKGKSFAEEKEIFKKCRQCHPNRLDKSYFMYAPSSKFQMITDNCKRCHPAIANQAEEDYEKAREALTKEGLRAPRKMPNVHPLHLGMDIYCNKCHSRVVHNNDPETAPLAMHDCTGCHNGEDAPFDNCKTCHIGIKKLFEGNTGRNVEATPAIMADIECTDCHNANRRFTVSAQACIDCHDDSYGQEMIDDFQKEYNERFAKAGKAYEKTKSQLEFAQRKGKDVSSVVTIFKNGEYNFKLAKIDGSRGVHNSEYTDALLESAIHTFEEVGNMLEAVK